MSREELDRRSQHGREVAAKRQKAKEYVYELEKKNDHQLIAFYSGDGWHKFGGHSALFFANMIAPRLGVKASLRPDTDFFAKFDDGVVSVRNLDVLKASLEGIGVKMREETELWIIFDLESKVSAEELDVLRSVRKERIDQVNKIVKTGNIYPSISAKARYITKDLYTQMNHCKPVDREFVLMRMVQIAFDNLVNINLISNGIGNEKEILHSVLIKNEKLKIYLMNLMELRVMDPEDVLRIETDLVDMNTQINKALKKLAKDE